MPLPTLPHDRRIQLLVLLAGAPALATVTFLLWRVPASGLLRGTILGALLIGWLWTASYARRRVVRPLQVIANLLAGLREGHFTMRARREDVEDDLAVVLREINALGDTLESQRLGAVEADALLRRVMEEIDLGVFAFDAGGVLRLVNRTGERLLGHPAGQLIGRSAEALGLAESLSGPTSRTLERVFPGGSAGRWEVRRSTFRQEGRPHDLLVLADLSRALREEERQVWQRLVRVLSHEINNSLAPIKSLAGTMGSLLARNPRPDDLEDDLRSGLAVIDARSDALARFMSAYARLARLPSPTLGEVAVSDWVSRVASLDHQASVRVEAPEAPVVIRADADQLDQLLINLVKNAVESVGASGGGVTIGWESRDRTLELWVRDEGPGLGPTGNLFVPFYTTKPSGSGIGLVFSRQVAEAHGGTLSLQDRTDRTGCEARLKLPGAVIEDVGGNR
ncbi:MAG: PAS domain-containing sensor histidine kinase [Gemmatimonadales bacterium]